MHSTSSKIELLLLRPLSAHSEGGYMLETIYTRSCFLKLKTLHLSKSEKTPIHLWCFFPLFKYHPVPRQPTQDAPEEVRARDFRRELEERERVAVRDKTRERGPRGWSVCRYYTQCLLKMSFSVNFWPRFDAHENSLLKYFTDPHFPEHTTSSSSSSSKRPRLDQIPAANLDADDPLTDVSTCTARPTRDLTVISTH